MRKFNYNDRNLLLFDGYCNLCSGLVKWIRMRTQVERTQFIALQSPAGKEVLSVLDLSLNDLRSAVYLRYGKAYFRSAAVIHLLVDLGGLWQFCLIFLAIPPILRDPLYNLSARSRYLLFGKRSSCMV